ncbi:MAG: AraC family transcriptional regulator [Clostridia bacterium]|nr:AraC family transcriptional regulator [Clostridia bacterium]
MKNQINKPTLNISVFGTKLKVIRVGKSPRLIDSAEANIKVNRIHSHFTCEAFFITEGSLRIVTDIERTTYERGVVIIPPHIGHYTLPKGDGCFCLLFSIEGENRIREKLGEGICKIPMSDDVEYCIKALSRKSDEGTALSEKDAELFATLIFNQLICAIDPDIGKKHPSVAESKHIGAIETYINNNLQKKITLSDVASQVYLSKRQIARILQKEYGCTLSQLVTEKKLASAKMMLKDTDMKIGEIASSVNLGAENYFYLLFKKKYGVSPLRYRKQTKKPD